jgi:hypothetical protein
LPRKPAGDRAMTGAEREARRRQRIKQDNALAHQALAFILTLAEQDAYSMPFDKRRLLRDLQMRGRLARLPE